MIKALVRTHRWRRRIESGRAKSITDLAEQEGVVETILDGRQPKGVRLAEMLGNGPLGWEEQRASWGSSRSAARRGS